MDRFWICLFVLITVSAAALVPSTDREVFARFHTLPKSRPPLLNITVHEPDLVNPGYLFLAPYAQLEAKEVTDPDEAYLTGPAIYDDHGHLIWTGSAMFPGRDAYDFRVSTLGNDSTLSFIISSNKYFSEDPHGKAVRLNAAYEPINVTLPLFDTPEFNIHEYNTLDEEGAVLFLYSNPVLVDDFWVMDEGIAEIDLVTGATRFRWSALEHIALNESKLHQDKAHKPPKKQAWDWFHANSIDKNPDGDYLLSARHASTIYKISGTDGSLLWTLGGKHSDFEHLSGFNFSWQHDARFIREDESKTIISLFNNAGVGAMDTKTATGNWSQALIVQLDTSSTPMTAEILSSYDRPDHGISIARGNMQILPNGNVLAGWSSYGSISEFTPEGSLVMEARFLSDEMSTYRSYRFNFSGTPSVPPITRSIAQGVSLDTANTFHHASWNGATNVYSWNFFGASDNSSLDTYALLGSVRKYDFETTFMTKGYTPFVYVEAVDEQGTVLSRSIPVKTEAPDSWKQPDNLTPSSSLPEHTSHEKPKQDDIDGKQQKPPEHGQADQSQHNSTAISRITGADELPMLVAICFLVLMVCLYLFVKVCRLSRRNVNKCKVSD